MCKKHIMSILINTIIPSLSSSSSSLNPIFYKVYLDDNIMYPLYVTKILLQCTLGKRVINDIDWIKSRKHCLFVKKKYTVKLLHNITFFYPNGLMFKTLKINNETEEEEEHE